MVTQEWVFTKTVHSTAKTPVVTDICSSWVGDGLYVGAGEVTLSCHLFQMCIDPSLSVALGDKPPPLYLCEECSERIAG